MRGPKLIAEKLAVVREKGRGLRLCAEPSGRHPKKRMGTGAWLARIRLPPRTLVQVDDASYSRTSPAALRVTQQAGPWRGLVEC